MKFIKKFGLCVLSAMLMFTFCSCEDDDESVDLYYSYVCSKDLLDFVTPTISYTDENGVERSITLSDEYWQQEGGTIGEEDSSAVVGNYRHWRKHLHFDRFGISSKAVVKYVQKTNTEATDKGLYRFKHNITCGGKAHSNHVQTQHAGLDLTEDIIVSKEDVAEYINNLINTPDEVQCRVGKNGEIYVTPF